MKTTNVTPAASTRLVGNTKAQKLVWISNPVQRMGGACVMMKPPLPLGMELTSITMTTGTADKAAITIQEMK